MCLPKNLGGLDVKCLEDFNIELLTNWKWRVILQYEAVWYEFISYKYDNLNKDMLEYDSVVSNNKIKCIWPR